MQPKEFARYNDKGQVKLNMCKSQDVNVLSISTNTQQDHSHKFQSHQQQEMTNGIVSVCFITMVLPTSKFI